MRQIKGLLQWGMNTMELWRDGFTVAKVGYGNSPIPRYTGTIEEERQNGLDLQNAYNNTIATGINPEAVGELNARLQEITLAAKFDCPKTDAWSILLKTCEQTLIKAESK